MWSAFATASTETATWFDATSPNVFSAFYNYTPEKTKSLFPDAFLAFFNAIISRFKIF